MSTFLANLASRAMGPTSMNGSRVLRPVVLSAFASSAFESVVARPLDFAADEMRSMGRSQQAARSSLGSRQAPPSAGDERSADGANSDGVRLQSANAAVGLAPPDLRRDVEPVAGETDPPKPPEPKIAVDQSSGGNSKNKSERDSSNNDRPVLPQQAHMPVVADREWEDQARQTASRAMARMQPGKLDSPQLTSAFVAEQDSQADSARTIVHRDGAVPVPPTLPQSSRVALHASQGLLRRPVPNQPVPNQPLPDVPFLGSERKAASASQTAEGMAENTGLHGEAGSDRSPMRATRELAQSSGSNASPNLASLRDRSMLAALAQTQPSLPSALRSRTAAHQPAASAPQNIVEVHIGRVEVRAPAQSSSTAAARESRKAPSLDDYLRGRTGRGRA